MNGLARTMRLVIGVTAALYLVGCATPVSEPLLTNVDESHPRAKLIIGSSELLGTVFLVNPRFREVGALTQSQVELENVSDFTIELEYRIDWRDASGFKAGPDGAWQFVTLSANSTEYITATGKVPEAEDITLTVRLPDELFEPVFDEP